MTLINTRSIVLSKKFLFCRDPHELRVIPFNRTIPAQEMECTHPRIFGDHVVYVSGTTLFRDLYVCHMKNLTAAICLYTESQQGQIEHFTMSKDQSTIALMSGQSVHIWNRSGEKLKELTGLSISFLKPNFSLSSKGHHLLFKNENNQATSLNIETADAKILQNLPLGKMTLSPQDTYAVWKDQNKLFFHNWLHESTYSLTLPDQIGGIDFSADEKVWAYSQDNLYSFSLSETFKGL